MDDLSNKVTNDQLTAAEFIQPMSEIQKIITDSGQTLSGLDLTQLSKALPIIVKTKTQALLLDIVDGRKIFITSTPDGGQFTMRSGAPIGTYNDNGGTYTGTKFTNGDGSSGIERDYSGAFNVMWFGATGDGVTDDTTAIRNTFTAGESLNANGISVYAPQGVYITSVTINVAFGMTFFGDGTQNTFIKYSGNASAIFAGYNTATRAPGLAIRNIGIETTSSSAVGLRILGPVGGVFENIHIVGKDSVDDTKTDIGVQIDVVTPMLSAFNNIFSNVEVSQSKTGFRCEQGATIQIFINCTHFGGLATGQLSSIAFDFVGGNDSIIIGGNAEKCGIGVYRRGGGGSFPTIGSLGLRFEGNTSDITIDGTAIWSGCKFLGGTQLNRAKVTDNTGSAKNWFDYNTGDDALPWTPNDVSGAGLIFTINASTFTKNKNTISLFIDIEWPVTADATQAQLSGIPFKSESEGTGGGYCHLVTGGTAGSNYTFNNVDDSSALNIYKDNVLATNAVLSGVRLRCVVIYKGV